MKRQALIGLKLLASLPLAVVLGPLAANMIETGLWPLALFPDTWLQVVDMITQAICQIIMFGGLVWFWALGR